MAKEKEADVLVRALYSAAGPGLTLHKGRVYKLPASVAKQLLEAGFAMPVSTKELREESVNLKSEKREKR
ncbi:MAG: hypothetical protein KatS3mg031_2985 [Chitinophagales bacterium]|nr:MAG: hypothetical protein KatS3mg031_2914 [Chitinophagales bacterium]GIV35450.1 MAG: hypothetical protein KatS3mg031_2985 [Chitinophagales bacterium]